MNVKNWNVTFNSSIEQSRFFVRYADDRTIQHRTDLLKCDNAGCEACAGIRIHIAAMKSM